MNKILMTVSGVLVAAGMAGGAQAVTPLTTTVSATQAQFATNLQSVTVTGSSAQASISGSSAGTTVNVAQFNTNTGILVGARATVNTIVSTTVQVGGVTGGTGSRTVTANTQQTGSVSVAGVTFSSTPQSVSRQCSGGNCGNSPGNNRATSGTATISGTTAVPAANLSAYAGTGNIGFTNTATGFTTATTNAGAPNGTGQSFMTFGSTTTANNAYSISYDYVKFAAPSFAGATVQTTNSLNFGTLALNSGSTSQAFSIFNIGDLNTAGLELYQINGPGGLFSSNISTFQDLAAGGSNGFTASFNPLNVGTFNGVYTFLFRDYAPGGVGIRNYSLTLNVAGSVFDPVPEPASWAMMMLGFGLVGAVARRRAAVRA